MTTTVRVVCRPATSAGFALAGLAADRVTEGEDPRPLLTAVMRRDDVGVVLLEEAIYDALGPETRVQLDRSAHPVVVPFPGPLWEAARRRRNASWKLLRRAIGYRVRIR